MIVMYYYFWSALFFHVFLLLFSFGGSQLINLSGMTKFSPCLTAVAESIWQWGQAKRTDQWLPLQHSGEGEYTWCCKNLHPPEANWKLPTMLSQIAIHLSLAIWFEWMVSWLMWWTWKRLEFMLQNNFSYKISWKSFSLQLRDDTIIHNSKTIFHLQNVTGRSLNYACKFVSLCFK
jgi:hypothetical protein